MPPQLSTSKAVRPYRLSDRIGKFFDEPCCEKAGGLSEKTYLRATAAIDGKANHVPCQASSARRSLKRTPNTHQE